MLQTCNGLHQSPINVDFTIGTVVNDSTDPNAYGELTFSGYDQVRAFLVEKTAEHLTWDPYSRATNKLTNKGGKTVVSNGRENMDSSQLVDLVLVYLNFSNSTTSTQLTSVPV